MTITINDLLQTIKHRLNRSMVQKPNVEQLNAAIDKLVNGGRVLEDEELDAFLNPPAVVEDLNQEIDAVYDEVKASGERLEIAINSLSESLGVNAVDGTMLSPEAEASLQLLVEESEKLGLYEMTGNPLDRTTSIATPLTMDELVAVAEAQIGLPMTNEEVQAEIDSGDLVPVAGSDIDFVTPTEEVAAGDTAVAEVTELQENTISDEAANVGSEQS